jgi:hypothetical protein
VKHLDRASAFVASKVNRALYSKFGKIVPNNNPLVSFVEMGSIGLLERDQKGPSPTKLSPEIAEAAANMGRIDLLQYLFNKNYPIDQKIFFAAVKHGHLDFLKLSSSPFPSRRSLARGRR